MNTEREGDTETDGLRERAESQKIEGREAPRQAGLETEGYGGRD